MFFSQLFFICNDDVKLILFASDFGFDFCNSMGKFFSFCSLVIKVCCIRSSFSFVLFSLNLNIIEGDFTFINLIVETSQFVFGSFGIFCFVFEFGNQFLVIIFSLMKSFVKLSINGFIVSDSSFKILQLLNIGI